MFLYNYSFNVRTVSKMLFLLQMQIKSSVWDKPRPTLLKQFKSLTLNSSRSLLELQYLNVGLG